MPPQLPGEARQARLLLVLVVCFFVSLNVMFFVHSCTRTPVNAITAGGEAAAQLVDHVGGRLESVAAAFNRGTITTSFAQYATTLTNTLRLDVATLRQLEIFTRTEELSTGFGYIPLPDVIVEARAPVEYTYYLDLNAHWRMTVKGQTVQVQAPALRHHTPALDVSGMTLEVRKGIFKVDEVQEKLRQSLTAMAGRQAQANVPLVRENARRQVERFVQAWLLRAFTDGPHYTVTVVFDDERPEARPTPAR